MQGPLQSWHMRWRAYSSPTNRCGKDIACIHLQVAAENTFDRAQQLCAHLESDQAILTTHMYTPTAMKAFLVSSHCILASAAGVPTSDQTSCGEQDGQSLRQQGGIHYCTDALSREQWSGNTRAHVSALARTSVHRTSLTIPENQCSPRVCHQLHQRHLTLAVWLLLLAPCSLISCFIRDESEN